MYVYFFCFLLFVCLFLCFFLGGSCFVLFDAVSPENYHRPVWEFMQLMEAIVQRCSVKRGVLENFIKFTGKHLCQSHFFNKVAGLRLTTLLKKRLWHRCFPANFVKFSITYFFIEHVRWLLLF